MKRFAILTALVCAPLVGHAADIGSLPSEELCVLFNLTLATGQPTYAGSQDQIKEALTARQEKCEPKELYMQAALQRARNLQAKAEMDNQVAIENARAQQVNEIYQDQVARERAQRRSEALRQLSDQLLNPPRAPQPTTTWCNPTYGGGVSCTTR